MHYSLGWSGKWNSTTWQMRRRAEYQASLMDFEILTDLSALDIERANLLYESYVERSRPEDAVTVQASLIYYILNNGPSARRRPGCSTLVRPLNHKCRIFFMVHHKSFPDLRHGLTDAPVSYGPYDDVTFQFLNGQYNMTTARGSRVEVSVTAYLAYYKGDVPVQNKQVKLEGTEGIATYMFVYDTAANQTNPVVMEHDRVTSRTWTKLYVGFELLK
ncbi:hypothetical protein RvY_13305 [Ramazzottius varieornatus]|uniref:Uncharacterized protein n=1 Tax=Ramazzottius varieornatus TaxID=947166 RepID=A0A1D1VP99_RAMVA|nr:hypothetical protein RvY_13305 [Ramazzottius varieornatus]